MKFGLGCFPEFAFYICRMQQKTFRRFLKDRKLSGAFRRGEGGGGRVEQAAGKTWCVYSAVEMTCFCLQHIDTISLTALTACLIASLHLFRRQRSSACLTAALVWQLTFFKCQDLSSNQLKSNRLLLWVSQNCFCDALCHLKSNQDAASMWCKCIIELD